MFSPKYYYRMKQKASKIEVTSTCKLLSVPSWIGIIGFGSSLIIIVFMFLLKSQLFPDHIYHIGCSSDAQQSKGGEVEIKNTALVEQNCRTITLYKIITIFLLMLSFVFLTVFCVAHYRYRKQEQSECEKERVEQCASPCSLNDDNQII